MAKKNGTIKKSDTDYTELVINDTSYKTTLTKKYSERKAYAPINAKHITSFMPGNIQQIYTKVGDTVKEGEKLLILEAMKMKNIIVAPCDGKIKAINVKVGEMVPKNFVLIEMK
ncbi:MAG: acetyl-CoA carboxylase biotin carboxyl carrier protein subunit [Bacteroidota bacterium]